MSTEGAVESSLRAAAPAMPWPRPGYAWYAVWLLVLAYAFGVLDRIVLSLLVQPVKADLGLSDTQMGLILGPAFALFYTLLGLPTGTRRQRSTSMPVVWAGLLLTSIATLGAGFAGAFLTLALARMAAGAGQATTWPACTSLIADFFPAGQRARAYGIFAMGGSIGIGMAYLLGGIAIDLAAGVRASLPQLLGGWREWQIVLLLVGAPGVLVALLMGITVREPLRRGAAAPPQALLKSIGRFFAEVRINGVALTAVMLGAVANTMVINAQLSWLPTFFERTYGMPAAQVPKLLALVGVPCGLLSAVTAGWVLSWLAKRGRDDGPVLVIMLQLAVWLTFGTLKCFMPTPELALALHVVTSLFATWALTATFTALNQITPNRLRGQMVALYALLTGFVAVSIGAVLVGLLSDHVFTGPRGIAPSLATACAAGGLFGILVIWWGRRAYLAAVVRSRTWEN
ncbi:MAG TPA: MFS transporter [Steroidobacteraceae bacterium]|nr:MFS transporter [Steroidobacteraceae bacterium]